MKYRKHATIRCLTIMQGKKIHMLIRQVFKMTNIRFKSLSLSLDFTRPQYWISISGQCLLLVGFLSKPLLCFMAFVNDLQRKNVRLITMSQGPVDCSMLYIDKVIQHLSHWLEVILQPSDVPQCYLIDVVLLVPVPLLPYIDAPRGPPSNNMKLVASLSNSL